jgi:hypothetical protein
MEGVKNWQPLRHLNCFRIKSVLGHDISTPPAELLEEVLEGPPYDRRRGRLICRPRHHQRLIRTSRYWDLDEIHPWHLRAFGAIDQNVVAPLGQTYCQVAKDGLSTAKLCGLQRSHQRGDDRDLQCLCWM